MFFKVLRSLQSSLGQVIFWVLGGHVWLASLSAQHCLGPCGDSVFHSVVDSVIVTTECGLWKPLAKCSGPAYSSYKWGYTGAERANYFLSFFSVLGGDDGKGGGM